MNILFTIASALRDGVIAQLPNTVGGLPNKLKACVVPGELAWDDCGCGYIGVELNGTAYSLTPPAPDYQRDGSCHPYVVGSFTITLLRCMPGPEAGGKPPSCAKLEDAAEIMFDDVLAVMRASTITLMALESASTIIGFAMGGVTPVGPQGLCGGVTQQVHAYIPNLYGPC